MVVTKSYLKNVRLTFENCEDLVIPGKYVKHLYAGKVTKSGSGKNLWVSCSKDKECHDGWYDESESVDGFQITIDKKFLDSPFYSFMDKDSGMTKFQRLITWKDITWVNITNKQYRVIFIKNPVKYVFKYLKNAALFLFQHYTRFETLEKKKYSILDKWRCYNRFRPVTWMNSSFKFSWRMKNKTFCYSMPWYYNGGDENETFIDKQTGKTCRTDENNKWQKVSIDVEYNDGEPYVEIEIRRDAEC